MKLTGSILSYEEIVELDRASMKLLSEVGVLVASEKALKLLDAAGAQIDYAKEIAKIPENSFSRYVNCFERPICRIIRIHQTI